MRKSEQAEQFFQHAHTASLRFEKEVPENLQAYHQFMAQGMKLIAACIRDIYDELESIHQDIRAGRWST